MYPENKVRTDPLRHRSPVQYTRYCTSIASHPVVRRVDCSTHSSLVIPPFPAATCTPRDTFYKKTLQ